MNEAERRRRETAMWKQNAKRQWIILAAVFGLMMAAFYGCGQLADETGGQAPAPISQEQKELAITVSGDGVDGEKTFTLEEMAGWEDGAYEHVYSCINNWPTNKFYVGRGIQVERILKEAGVYDTGQTFTFRSPDSYEMTFTREQLLTKPQYYFPGVVEGNPDGAEEVKPIIAYEWAAGTSDLSAAAPDKLCLIVGQTNHLEHNNPVFVENVADIIVSSEEPQAWEPATTFPAPGAIAAGETVKLQHPSIGLVKLFYTLDGTEPTEMSAMYNPSTYQPELNRPIPITETTTLKVLVTGYGKKDSEIATYEFTVQ